MKNTILTTKNNKIKGTLFIINHLANGKLLPNATPQQNRQEICIIKTTNDNKLQQTTTKLFAALAIIITTITSCGNPKELVYQDVQNFRVLTLSLEPQIGMDVQFYNPNSYGMTLKDANIDVYINDKPIGKTSLEKKYSVPAQDTFLLPVTLTANLKNVVANAYSLLSNKEVTVRLQGTVKAGKGAFVTIPINYTGRQRLNVADFK